MVTPIVRVHEQNSTKINAKLSSFFFYHVYYTNYFHQQNQFPKFFVNKQFKRNCCISLVFVDINEMALLSKGKDQNNTDKLRLVKPRTPI